MKLDLTVMQVQDIRTLVTEALDSRVYLGDNTRLTKRLKGILGVIGNALEEYEFGVGKK